MYVKVYGRVMGLIRQIINLILRLLGLHNPVVEGEDSIDQQIEDNNDKIEEINDENYDADSLADAINNDK